jgi:hypothetical protein
MAVAIADALKISLGSWPAFLPTASTGPASRGRELAGLQGDEQVVTALDVRLTNRRRSILARDVISRHEVMSTVDDHCSVSWAVSVVSDGGETTVVAALADCRNHRPGLALRRTLAWSVGQSWSDVVDHPHAHQRLHPDPRGPAWLAGVEL